MISITSICLIISALSVIILWGFILHNLLKIKKDTEKAMKDSVR